MKMLPLLLLSILCACAGKVQIIDLETAEEIPTAAALGYLAKMPLNERTMHLGLKPTENGFLQTPKRGAPVLTPYSEWRVSKASFTTIVTDFTLVIVLERKGKKKQFYWEKARRGKEGEQELRERGQSLLQALSALGVQVK